MDLKDHIRSVPDFPKPGILFYDISTLLIHPVAWLNASQPPSVPMNRISWSVSSPAAF